MLEPPFRIAPTARILEGLDAQQAIYDWSLSQPPWRRDLLRRVAAGDADDKACLEVLDLLLGSYGLAPTAPASKPLELGDLPVDVPAASGVLYEIGECSNVNAIDSPNPLPFAPTGITLIYGPNGVGKSSYARIVKRVARAAHEEPILPNVYSSAASPPRAVIDLENEAGRTKHIVPLGERGKPLLASMTVFDAHCAGVYLRREKTIAFTPTPLRIFGRAAAAQRRIRELLDGRLSLLESRRPSLDAFGEDTEVRRLLESLNVSTPDSELARLASLSPDELERAAEARLELAAVDAGAVEGQARAREREAEALDRLANALHAAAVALGTVASRVIETTLRLAEALDAVRLARETAFVGDPVPAAGSDGWRRMWEAARSFVEQDCRHQFPPRGTGDVCPLCQQELSDAARDRFRRFEEFVTSTLEQELVDARREADTARGALTATTIRDARHAAALELLIDEQPELSAAINGWLDAAEVRAAALKTGSGGEPLADPPVAPIRQLATEHRDAASRQRALIDAAAQAALRQEVAEFGARQQLHDRLTEIREWHATLKSILLLEAARRDLDTTSLSHKQTEMATRLITDELRRATRRELDSLGFADLKVDLSCRGDKGTTVARLGLEGTSAAPADVLSESEQQGCALAFFLAESLTSASSGGIVFDDPASSFDVEKIDHIAARIVELARKRQQVIVFTHNIVLAWCIADLSEAKKVPLKVQPLARIGNKVGVVRKSQAWPGEPLRVRLGRLRAALQDLEALERKADIDRYEIDAKVFAGDLREAWERAVEELLFQKVVMRFQRDVSAKRIRDVVVTPNHTREVYDGMTETSPFHHEASLAKPVATPTIADLKGFFARLEKFCNEFNSKTKGAAKTEVAAPDPAA